MTPARDRLNLLFFFSITFTISWGIGGLCILAFGPPGYVIGKSTSNSLFFLFFGFGPTFAAFITTALATGKSGVGKLFKSLTRWPSAPRWYAVVLIGIPALAVCQAVVSSVAGAGTVVEYLRPPPPAFGTRWYEVALYIVAALIGEMLGGPLSEEPGWRGYALPMLLKTWTPLAASFALGGIWAVWHLPLFFLPGVVQFHESFVLFAANVVALSILITWVFIHTEGNVFLAILMHLLFNLTANSHHMVAMTAVNATVATLVIARGGLSTRRPQIGRARGSQTAVYATIAALIMLLGLSAAGESRASEQACGPFGDPPAKVLKAVKPECTHDAMLVGPWNDGDGTPRYA